MQAIAILEQQETNLLVRRAMRRLHPHDAFVLDMFYLREQSMEEIITLTGWADEKIQDGLSQARKQLRDVLLREGALAQWQ